MSRHCIQVPIHVYASGHLTKRSMNLESLLYSMECYSVGLISGSKKAKMIEESTKYLPTLRASKTIFIDAVNYSAPLLRAGIAVRECTLITSNKLLITRNTAVSLQVMVASLQRPRP